MHAHSHFSDALTEAQGHVIYYSSLSPANRNATILASAAKECTSIVAPKLTPHKKKQPQTAADSAFKSSTSS